MLIYNIKHYLFDLSTEKPLIIFCLCVGNTWGCAPDGDCCLGCASKQETFINCADIAIFDDGGVAPPTSGPSTGNPPTQAPTTAQPTERPTTQAPPTAAPTTHSPTTQSPTDAPTTQGPSTQSPTDDCVLMECPVGLTLMCDGTGDLAGDLTRQRFCNDHCRLQTASCTTQLCSCTCKKITCKAVGGYEGSPTHDDWCQTICTQDSNLCPDHRDQCQCTEDL